MNAFRITPMARIGWRDALLALALFGALFRAFMPVGFMPEVKNGALTMVICTAAGAVRLDGADSHDGKTDAAVMAAQMPCAFAAVAAMAPPPEAPILSIAQAIALNVAELDSRPVLPREAAFRPQAQRAPPSLQA